MAYIVAASFNSDRKTEYEEKTTFSDWALGNQSSRQVSVKITLDIFSIIAQIKYTCSKLDKNNLNH